MTSETPSGDTLALIGTTIAEKYAIESVVGQGGFATVYRATHVLWKRTVAVKVFTALGEVAKEQRQKLLDDFIQEGALLADLSERSTAICQARDVGSFTLPGGETVPYMVLEWLDGQTLEALFESERARDAKLRTLEEAVRFLDPIALALALAHKKGIAHRDVKPANVFVLRETHDDGGAHDGPPPLKLLDFGIAKVVQDVQRMGFGKTAGHITSFTPLYGAPEQFDRNVGATGPWTDVFAFALVFAEMVSGREPMSGDSLVQLAVAASDPVRRPTPRTLGVAMSDEVDAVFQRAVAVKPADRYATVGEFWNALRAALYGEDVSSSFRGSLPGSSTRLPVSSRNSSRAALAATDASLEGVGVVSSSPIRAASSSSTGSAPTSTPIELASSSLTTGEGAGKARSPLVFGALGLAVVGVLGVVAWKATSTPPPNPPPIASTATPIASTSAPIATVPKEATPALDACPTGMLRIPGGEFFMGSDEKDALDIEKPAHKVKLAPYCIDEFEVSVAQYKKCSDEGGCRRASKENVWPGIKPAQRKIYDPLCNINDPEGKANHPINCVEWDQAREYCETMGARLPTEAEWEFAARGPDGRIYPWGDERPSKDHLNACGKECVAWQKTHPDPDGVLGAMYDEDDGFPNTAPVGSFPKGKSRYGVQDVVGNVWEWVADFYAPYAKSTESTEIDPKGPTEGDDRVIRGGAWNGAFPSWVRPAFRYHVAPSSRSYGFGFRCAK